LEYFDFWNVENEMVTRVYETENIKVLDYSDSPKCYIFFSSNGLFYPNTLSEFEEKVIKKDRYEWENIASSKEIKKVCGRAIFVRDIYKQYYVTGVSKTNNSIDKVLEKLKELSKGYEIVTVGSSAGGYMAMLAGALLKATDCYSFSGQVSLYRENRVEIHPFLKRYANDREYNKYYDIIQLIKESNTNIWYFYPFYNEADKEEFGCIEDGKCVKGFAFAMKNHAETMYAENMKHIVSKSTKEMENLYFAYKGQAIERDAFFRRTVSVSTRAAFYKKKIIRFMKRRLKK